MACYWLQYSANNSVCLTCLSLSFSGFQHMPPCHFGTELQYASYSKPIIFFLISSLTLNMTIMLVFVSLSVPVNALIYNMNRLLKL